MEALLEILHILHVETFPEENLQITSMACRPICPAHQAFCLVIEESMECMCGKSNRSYWDYCAFAHPFYVSQIFEEAKGEPEKLVRVPIEEIDENIELSSVAACENRLNEFIRMQWQMTIEMCPMDTSTCMYSRTSRSLTIKHIPQIYIIHLIWENSRPLLINLLQAYSAIPYSLDIKTIYNSDESQFFSLESMILYGSSHYISMIKKENTWFKVDDEAIMYIGTWQDVIIRIIRSRFYPVGLIYARANAFEVNNISLRTWIEFEREILLSSESREVGKMPSGWQCACGNFNHKMFEVCENCRNLKPGVEGWACSFCTTLNDNASSICASCTKPKFLLETKPMRTQPLVNVNRSIKYSFSPQQTQEIKKARADSVNVVTQARPTGRFCSCCSRKLTSEYFTCFECYLKSKENICQYCRFEASNAFCDICIKSNIKCECGKRYQIIYAQCQCKTNY